MRREEYKNITMLLKLQGMIMYVRPKNYVTSHYDDAESIRIIHTDRGKYDNYVFAFSYGKK